MQEKPQNNDNNNIAVQAETNQAKTNHKFHSSATSKTSYIALIFPSFTHISYVKTEIVSSSPSRFVN